jgi:hypothetical protein
LFVKTKIYRADKESFYVLWSACRGSARDAAAGFLPKMMQIKKSAADLTISQDSALS